MSRHGNGRPPSRDELINVSEVARGLGFAHPVKVTRAVWAACGGGRGGPATRRALVDLLSALRTRIRELQADGVDSDRVRFGVRLRGPRGAGPAPLHLTAACGRDEHRRPVVTIALDGER